MLRYQGHFLLFLVILTLCRVSQKRTEVYIRIHQIPEPELGLLVFYINQGPKVYRVQNTHRSYTLGSTTIQIS